MKKTAQKRKGSAAGKEISTQKAPVATQKKKLKTALEKTPKKAAPALKKAVPSKAIAKKATKSAEKVTAKAVTKNLAKNAAKRPVAKTTVLKGKSPRISNVHAVARQKRVISGSWLAKPWPVDRIRGFMSTWGMTQAEFAIFCGVSYDTVTSWSRGRRNLVRVDQADHIMSAEKTAAKRKLPMRDGTESVAPWADLRNFVRRYSPVKRCKNIPADMHGSFTVVGVEMSPDDIRLAESIENVEIGRAKSKKDDVPVTIIANNLEISLEGRWRELGGARLLELLAPPEDPHFFSGHAGCIIPGKQNMRINLWSTDKKIPMRLIAVKR